MIKILFVCHGNICRSTMCESYFTYLVNQRGLSDLFFISSAATSREEIGNPPHYGTVNKLREEGIPLVPHRAVQMTAAEGWIVPIYAICSVLRGEIKRIRSGSCFLLQG